MVKPKDRDVKEAVYVLPSFTSTAEEIALGPTVITEDIMMSRTVQFPAITDLSLQQGRIVNKQVNN